MFVSQLRFIISAIPALLIVLLISTPAKSEEQLNTPKGLAESSFKNLQNQEFEKFAKQFHPDALKRFKNFGIKIFELEQTDPIAKHYRSLFKPYEKIEEINKADDLQFFQDFFKNAITSNPGVIHTLKFSKLEILGEIYESENSAYVITRTVSPRPNPVHCIKIKEQWLLDLNDEHQQLLINFEKYQVLKQQQNSSSLDIQKSVKIKGTVVVGYVLESEDLAQALCRTESTIADQSFPIIACYPVRKGDTVWEHLKANDKAAMADAFLKKWNAGK